LGSPNTNYQKPNTIRQRRIRGSSSVGRAPRSQRGGRRFDPGLLHKLKPVFEIPPRLIEIIHSSQKLVVLTGAGISSESGVPTFRDAQTGLWAQFKPEELATPEAFLKNPKKVWEWYAYRREKISQVKPNPGHFALAELEKRIPHFTLITQNVDGLHKQAGSRNIIELHGNIHRTKCFKEEVVVESWGETEEIPPRCPHCGGMLRPDVVWFGEPLPIQAFQEAIEASQSCDLFFSVGTSSLVYPAASLPYEALQHGAKVIEINPEETELTPHAHYFLRGPSGKILPALVEKTWPSPSH
jgi:NAD-dependent deacetylase